MKDLIDELKEIIRNAHKPCPSCTPIVNVNCPQGAGTIQQAAARPCPPVELIKNGGFEFDGQFTVFRDWEQASDANIEISQNVDNAYEGSNSAEFRSISENGNGNGPTVKTAALRQNVTVTPGCFLVLSFADNFLSAGDDYLDLDVAGRVFYTDAGGNRVNLINIEIDYQLDQEGNGFVFHQHVSDNPVPFNVSSVTVEFFVEIEDLGGTSWLVDGVSLRAV